MKSISFIALVVLFATSASAQKVESPKTYTVTLAQDKWEWILQALDSAQKVIVASDAPARNASSVNFKLSSLMQTIQTQVGQQLAEEQRNSADTSKGKNPKK